MVINSTLELGRLGLGQNLPSMRTMQIEIMNSRDDNIM